MTPVVLKRTFSYLNGPCLDLSQQQKQLVHQFNQRVESGEIQRETISCLCGNNEFDLISKVDWCGMLQDTVLCTRCGLILSNPRLTASEYREFYTSDLYRRCYDGEDYVSVCEAKYTSETGTFIFDAIARIRPANRGRILEFGAGGGWNLLPFIEQGARAEGLDYSTSLVALGRRHGIDMAQGGIDDIDGTYDVIILNHVLEHLIDPMDAIGRLANHLSRTGIVYIAVPDILNFAIGQLQSAHVWYFSPRTLKHYCGVAGLRLIANGPVDGHMFGIFEKSQQNGSVFQSDLDGHYQEVVAVIRRRQRREIMKRVLSRFHVIEPARAVYEKLR